MLESVNAALFRRHVGDRFTMRVDDTTALEALLEDVEQAAWAFSPTGERTPFTLYFRTESAEVHPQRIYRMEHEVLGAIDMFLVPSARDHRGVLYEAVFS